MAEVYSHTQGREQVSGDIYKSQGELATPSPAGQRSGPGTVQLLSLDSPKTLFWQFEPQKVRCTEMPDSPPRPERSTSAGSGG